MYMETDFLSKLQNMRLSRRQFLRLSALGMVALVFWSPWRGQEQAGALALPSFLDDVVKDRDFSSMRTMTQAEYDQIDPTPDTLYIILA